MVVILLLSSPNASASTGCDENTVEDDDDNNSTSTGITAIPTTTYFNQRYPYPNFTNFTPPKYVKFKIDGEDEALPPPRPPLPKEYSFYEPNKVPKPPRHIFSQEQKSTSKPNVRKPIASNTTSTTRDYVRHVTRVNFFDSQVEQEGGEDGDTEAITKEGESFLFILFTFLYVYCIECCYQVGFDSKSSS